MDHNTFLLQHCKELIGLWQDNISKIPAHRVAREYFQKKRHLGSKDRRFISKIFWEDVRKTRLIENVGEKLEKDTDRAAFHTILTYIHLNKDQSQRPEDELLADIYDTLIDNLEKFALSDKIEDAYPEWFTKYLSSYLNPKEKEETLNYLSKESGLHLRINTHKCNKEKLLKEMPNLTVGTIAKGAFRHSGRIHLESEQAYRNGWIEVQDESSQLISHLANPKEDFIVVDAAAGGGGKSLHLSALMHNKGKILASDISLDKLAELRKRAKRSGCKNIQTLSIKDLFRNYTGKADLLLIDAPCSGSGTIRRQPDILHRQNFKNLKKFIFMQRSLLEDYEKLLKPGGILIYATCSLNPYENQKQIEGFLKKHSNYTLENAVETLNKQGMKIQEQLPPYLLILPQMFDSDGFFAARLRKK
ncbi:MAG: RsmB/NOP family class I SAM-dependent RNA methyltransferase [Candidatus Marinimicrobia bacterium]|nr:RsmB/NOP family class I SAM-dependent RNA methyltransferase [Candidatus Neomarinimicrobiota bacterium]